jgi:hypothetical protein
MYPLCQPAVHASLTQGVSNWPAGQCS